MQHKQTVVVTLHNNSHAGFIFNIVKFHIILIIYLIRFSIYLKKNYLLPMPEFK